MRAEVVQLLKAYVQREFSSCLLAVWGGSAAKGKANAASDLDLIVLVPGNGMRRSTFRLAGWLVEVFVITTRSYRATFKLGVQAGNPTLQRILTEGVVLLTSTRGDQVIGEARRMLAAGPMPWSSGELDHYRYALAECAKDLEGACAEIRQPQQQPGSLNSSTDTSLARLEGELYCIVSELVRQLCCFALRVNGCWVAEGKHLFQAVEAWNAHWARQLVHALNAWHAGRNPQPLLAHVEATLLPYGGMTLEGFEEG